VSEVLYTRAGPVATITLNRPAARNAFDPALIAMLTQLMTAAAMDDSRVVVLTGAGDAFSAGADVEWMRSSAGMTRERNEADAAAARTMFEAVDRCPKPVVARVNGHALGGGAGLVACADVAVAAEGTLFGFTEARLGLIPAMISPYVLRRVGPGPARALFVTAERFGAERARELGLVHRVVAPDDLDAAVGEVADGLLACGPVAIAESKRLIRDATASLALDDLPARIAAVRAGPEGQEGLRAFLERRRPGWSP
jgi:methylglutaconyl-CoA hydratase